MIISLNCQSHSNKPNQGHRTVTLMIAINVLCALNYPTPPLRVVMHWFITLLELIH